MPTVSCCIITLNQATRLKTAINSITKYVDEVVVIDGGSKDNSKQIAKFLEARVFERKWDNDFGTQRNFAIERSNGDWIFMLDTDELARFGNRKNFSKIISENKSYDGFKIIRSNYLDNSKTGSIYDYDEQLRLFKRYARYEDKIHEIPRGLHNVGLLDRKDLMILHYKSREEQKQHLMLQKKIILNYVKILKKKKKLSEAEKKSLFYQEKMLQFWKDWWKDTEITK